ncbi:MAG TPA: TetR/AcrR family transcriptional regulator [Streptosporangiaceae bacterium]
MAPTRSGDVPASADRTRRDEILRIAADVFARTDYSGTSLRDIADAAGILAGSLYHHFPSKESLAIELISGYHAEIDDLVRRFEPDPDRPLAGIAEFADQIGRIVQRHRGAAQMCRLDAPSSATEALSALVGRKQAGLDRRWAELLRLARGSGALRADIDLATLQAVLSSAVFDLVLGVGAEPPSELVGTLTSLVLHGLATASQPAEELDASAASQIARDHAEAWTTLAEDSGEGRRGQILATARQEFARRGYEATTIRDISTASGIRPSSIYRHFRSKQEILNGIVARFSRFLLAGYEAVAAAPGSASQRLDALCWLMASAASRFRPEFVIVKDWWRVLDNPTEAPPEDNSTRLRLLEGVISDGIASGEFTRPRDPARLAVALRATLWVPLTESAASPVPRRHTFLRRSLLNGAATTEARTRVTAP